MFISRFALGAVALAVCQMAVAQTPSAAPTWGAPAPAATPAPAVAVAAQPVPGADSSKTVAPAQAGAEPRYIRGNDQVIAPPKTEPVVTGSPVTFNFEEAPVAEVVRTILGDILRTDYVLHPPLSGTVTLSTRNPIPPDQAIFLLESALQANGLALLRDARGSYHVGRPDALRGIGGAVRQAASGKPMPPGYGVVVVPLQYIGAGEMASILRPMIQPDALIRVDTVRNLLVMSGTRTQAEGWLDLVNTFDVDLLKGMSVGVFPLKYASIREVEAALRLVSGGGAVTSPTGGSGAGGNLAAVGQAGGGAGAANQAAQGAAMLGEANPFFGALRIMPIERLNSILVVTPRAAYLDEARRWIERLDQQSDNGAEPQLFIYQVQNGNARHLAGVLSGIFGGTGNTGTTANSGVAPGLTTSTNNSFGSNSFGNNNSSQFGNYNSGSSGSFFGSGSSGLGSRSGGLGSGSNNAFGNRGMSNQNNQTNNNAQAPVSANIGGVRVMADELNNSVLVWGTRAEYAKIEVTLKRLDLPPTQVLIEASIVEVTLNDELQYGLEWTFGKPQGANEGFGSLLAGGSSRNPLTALTNGFSYTLRNSAGNVSAVLRALSQKTSVKMIASPSLMVLDNHSAAIAVGNQTPIVVGTLSTLNNTTDLNQSTSYQYKDTGVNLVVTPSVNAGNMVTMQVEQSLTDVGAQDDVTKQRSFLQRQMSSKLAVRSGESIVMGGLIQDRSSITKSGVPLLHTLPLVGNLFGSTGNDGARTELVVIITPRVVRSDIDIREVSEDLRDRMKGLQFMELKERTKPLPPVPQTILPIQPLPAQ